jgi:hypothetical protein
MYNQQPATTTKKQLQASSVVMGDGGLWTAHGYLESRGGSE